MGPKIIENGQKASLNEKTTKIPDFVKYLWGAVFLRQTDGAKELTIFFLNKVFNCDIF